MTSNLRSLKVFALSMLILSTATEAGIVSSVSSAATSAVRLSTTTAKYATAAAFIASLVYFFHRRPTADDVRYNLDELMNGENIAENAKYLILDGLIGHQGKKSGLSIGEDGKEVSINKGICSKGVYGTVSDFVSPVTKAILFVAAFQAFKQSLADGKAAYANFSLSTLCELPLPTVAQKASKA